MPELNLKQITDKLNAEFACDTRKLVFWYDEKAEFADDIDSLELVGAKVYHLEPDNQFQTKYFLERKDRDTSYLIYAPFPKPPVRDNHMEDTLLYSKQFFADRASLLTVDLGIDEKYKPVIQKYIKFFGAKDRTQRFYDLEVENFTRESIEVALMSVLCKTRTSSFEEVLRVIMTDDGFEGNKFLAEFEKYNLLAAFWRLCEEQFGYTDVKPTLEKLFVTMFVTYTERFIHGDIPQAWRSFVSYKSGNIIAYMDNLMNNILYRERYDEISGMIADSLNVKAAFKSLEPDTFAVCDSFSVIDLFILEWITGRLLAEDTGAKLDGHSILELCELRSKRHFGGRYLDQYSLLRCACGLVSAANYSCPDDFSGIVTQYQTTDCLIDTDYREFYYHYDKLTDHSAFEDLRELVENIYTNEYLSKVLPKWNKAFAGGEALSSMQLQRKFYDNNLRYSKERTVVIISDAMRYEVGRSLFTKLQDDEKSTVKIEPMMSVLPSFTQLGMAALLPHMQLDMTDDYKVLVDGQPCDTTKAREAQLKKGKPNSRCVDYNDLRDMKDAELREVFTGMEVVYIYHNQIDVRGESPKSENEVFIACQEAIEEIYALVKRISTRGNTYKFIITADHGFIYKRDKLQESDKISNTSGKASFLDRRFIVFNEAIIDDGVDYAPMSKILGNQNSKIVSYPVSTSVFKSGGGQNYVHGGSSPQEMLVPVISLKMDRYHTDVRPATIAMVSMVQKITNLIASLDFIQSEPVSDIVKATSYKLFFISVDNEKISNECIYVADKKDIDPQKRIFRLRFNFKNKKYDKTKKYYLVAYDEKNDLEILRHDVVMDIAFANDFGFNV